MMRYETKTLIYVFLSTIYVISSIIVIFGCISDDDVTTYDDTMIRDDTMVRDDTMICDYITTCDDINTLKDKTDNVVVDEYIASLIMHCLASRSVRVMSYNDIFILTNISWSESSNSLSFIAGHDIVFGPDAQINCAGDLFLKAGIDVKNYRL